MKKYYQAALTITAVVSLIALVIYRHEYNKLRFVLTVVKYFGTPSRSSNETCTLSPIITRNFNADFTEPISSWQRISDDFHIFSAYNIDGEVRALAFGITENMKSTYSCSVTINPENPKVIPGKFSFEIMSENDSIDVAYVNGKKFYFLMLSCNNASILKDKKIMGVRFFEDAKKNSRNAIIKVRNTGEIANKSSSVVCVAPPNSEDNKNFAMKQMDMISFIAFHENIGLRDFVIYDFGINDVFNFAMKSLIQSSKINLTYSTVTWNFPFDVVNKMIRRIVETDCLYRTFGRAKVAVILTWNEYINLKYHSSIKNVISDFNKIVGKSGDSFKIESFVLCTEDAESDSLNISTPIILTTSKRLRMDNNKDGAHIYELRDREKLFGKRSVWNKLDDLVIIYKYESCHGDQETIDNQVLKFADVMPSTQIFQYYVNGKLFNN